jgi:hypothetical protein
MLCWYGVGDFGEWMGRERCTEVEDDGFDWSGDTICTEVEDDGFDWSGDTVLIHAGKLAN